MINLLFKSSLKKYQNVNVSVNVDKEKEKENELVFVLTKCISNKIDDKIMGGLC